MKNKKLILLSCLFLSIIGCDKKETIGYKKFDPSDKITHVRAIDSLQEQSMASPYDMYIDGHILIIEDIKSDRFIHIVDTKNMSLIKSTGTKGKGPGEIISSYGVIDFFNDNIWFYDGKLAKYVGYNTDSVLANSDYIPEDHEIRIDPTLKNNEATK